MTIFKPLFIFLIILSVRTSCLALQTFPLIDHESTQAIISEAEQNRIAVVGDRIQQVFGAEGTFDVQTDDEGGQIFLKVRDPHFKKTIPLTIITESGLTQDLKLTPKAIDAQSLLFKPTLHSQTGKEVLKEAESHLVSLINLMKAMVGNEELRAYTRMSYLVRDRIPLETPSSNGALPLGISPFCSLSSRGLQDIRIDPYFIYKGTTFEGKIYILTNQGKTPLPLKESDLALKEDLAIALSHKILLPQEKAKLYVISKIIPGKFASENFISGNKL